MTRLISRSGAGAANMVAGVALCAVAAAVCLLAPSHLNLILTIDSPGANHVVIPVAFWTAMIAAAVALARISGEPFRRAVSRLFVVAFITHMLLLLAASAWWVVDPAAYPARAYWFYARIFYASVVAGSIAWVVRRVQSSELCDDEWAALGAIAPAALVLTAIVFRHDRAAAAVGFVAGVALGALRPANIATRRLMTSARELLANDRVAVATAFGLALGLRLLYTARVMGNPNYIETGPDARFYDRLAWSLVQGQSIVDNGYPLLILGHVRFLALLYRVFGHNYLAVCVVQSFIGASATIGIYVIGKPVFGAVAARIAAVFTAISFQLAFWAVAIGYQTVDIGLTMFLVWLLIAAVERWPRRWWVWAIAGVAFGFAISVRETSAIFFAFACAWLLWALRESWAVRWRAVAIVAVGAIGVLVPMVAPMVATSERRMAMRRHFDRLATGDVVPGREGLAKPLSDPQTALKQLREQPGFVLRVEAAAVRRNIAMQFFTQPYGEFDLVTLRKESDYYYGVWSYAYVLTAIGMIVGIRRLCSGDPHAVALSMLLGVIVFRTLPHLYLESGYRHRAPLEPFLILFCAAGVVTALRTAWPPRTSARPTLQAAS